MRKAIILLAILIAGIVFAGSSEAAILVEGYATADNAFWVWGYDGAGDWDGSSWYYVDGNWRDSHKLYGYPELGQTNSLYFAVRNDGTGGSGNPAGLLASFTTSAGYFAETGTNKLLSDNTWEIRAHNSWTGDPTFDPETSTTGWLMTDWVNANMWGADNASNIWRSARPGQDPNIDDNAQWLWTDVNFSSNQYNYAVLRTQFTVVPEPASMTLLGMGLLGAIGIGIKKRKKIA